MSRLLDILALAGINSTSAASGDCENAQIIDTIRAEKPEMLGLGEFETVEVIQWVVASENSVTRDSLDKLENILSLKSFLVGQRLSVADIAMAWQLSRQADGLAPLPAVSRWYRLISGVTTGLTRLSSSSAPILFPLPVFDKVESKKEVVKEEKKDDAKVVKEDVTKASASKADASAAPAATASISATASSSATDDLDPSKLEIKVGLVVKCWNHEGSEKLLCEEIDLGEGSTRQIASGIRLHYSAEDVQGRKVLVLANLKERSIAGFKSQGMVLCASNADHTQVKLLEPPATASVGDKVIFAGYNGEPASAAHMAKKKIFESLAPFLRTDGQGAAHWKSAAFTIDGKNCVAPLPDATVA